MCFWESRRTTNDGMLTTWPRERSSYTPASHGLRPACPFWTVAGLGNLSRQVRTVTTMNKFVSCD